MERRKVISLSLFFLLGIGVFIQINSSPTIVSANVLETFSYNPIFWEDWKTTGAGGYTWGEENSTLVLNSSSGDYEISRALLTDEDEERSEIEWLARYRAQAASNWWDDDWTYRKAHIITGSTAGIQTNYQLRFEIHYGSGSDSGNIIYCNSHCQPDFDDIRFIKNDQTTELDYWLEERAGSVAYFWVEVDTIPASPSTVDIYIYYGNSGASSNSDGEATFLLFDNFNDASIDWSKWRWYNVTWLGEPVENNGLLMLNDTGDRIWFHSYLNFTYGVGITSSVYFDDFRYYGFAEVEPDLGDDAAVWNCYPGNERTRVWDEGVSTIQAEAQSAGSWQTYTVRWYSDAKANFDIDYTTEQTITGANVPDGVPNIPTCFYTYHGDANPLLWLNWTFVHKAADSEPSHTSTGAQATKYPEAEIKILYHQTITTTHAISLGYNDTALTFEYYNQSGNLITISYNFTDLHTAKSDYLRTYIELDTLTREIELTIRNSTGSTIWSGDYTTEATPPRLYAINASVSMGATLEFVWIDAPFVELSALREWHGTGTDATDSPYYIDATHPQDEGYRVKVMPFQGVKFLFNLTQLSGDVYNNVTVYFYDRAGELTGGCWVEMNQDGDLFGYIISSSNASTGVFASVTETDGDANFCAVAVWTEASGRTFFYIQWTPHSSEFQDFWVYDISALRDLDSWGAEIRHWCHPHTPGDRGLSAMQEVEIFYGVKEGISQPRFGGMWWLTNPIFFAFLHLISALATILAGIVGPIGQAVSQYISPQLGTILTGIGNGLTYLANLGNIWSVMASIVNDMVLEFINEFITPAIVEFANWVVLNFINSVFNAGILLQSVFQNILYTLSIWFWGDGTILPNVVNSSMLFLFATFQGIGYFLVSGRVFAIGFYILALLNGISTPIGWENLGTIATIPDMIMWGLYFVASYAPIFFMIYILLTLLSSTTQFIAGDFDFDSFRPFWEMFWFFWKIGEFIYALIRTMISLVWNAIVAIMEIIPF